jgi:hypothetical protein
MRALHLFLVAVSATSLHAQDGSWQASSIGSYSTEVSNSFFSNSLLLIEDMDNGTSFHIRDRAAVLHVSKADGIIWITSINANDTDQSIMMVGSLPFKIAPKTNVEFTCEQSRFIYIQELK